MDRQIVCERKNCMSVVFNASRDELESLGWCYDDFVNGWLCPTHNPKQEAGQVTKPQPRGMCVRYERGFGHSPREKALRQIEEAKKIEAEQANRWCEHVRDLLQLGYAGEVHGLIVVSFGKTKINGKVVMELDVRHISFCPMCGKGLDEKEV
jgi:hypothetical protein